jgi:hypothetical protein
LDYADDIYFFSETRQVEEHLKHTISMEIDIKFNGQVGYFLGINFEECKRHNNNSVSILMSQESFIDNLVELADLLLDNNEFPPTPSRSGYPVDKIPTSPANMANATYVKYHMQKFIG